MDVLERADKELMIRYQGEAVDYQEGPPPSSDVNGGVKVGRVGGRLLSIGDQILYRLPSFIGL